MNGAELLLRGKDPAARALIAVDAGGRRELTFGELALASAELASDLSRRGIGPGHVVLTLQGSRPEWVVSMLASLWVGAAVLPCVEQLRPRDLAARLRAIEPSVVLAGDRNLELIDGALALAGAEAALGNAPTVLTPALGAGGVRGEQQFPHREGSDAAAWLASAGPAPATLGADDPALLTFTSGTSGPPKAVVHGVRYVAGQRVQAEAWFGAQPGELAWCTAAPGWSKSARNVFIAPWLCGAAALLHDSRFDPQQRVAMLAAEQPAVLCMAPTEYRLLAKRADLTELPPSLRRLVAAGEALDPAVLHAWHQATGVWVRDGYGQTETGQLTAPPGSSDPVPGSMGQPLPGFALSVEPDPAHPGTGELVIDDPGTVPTFFLGYWDAEQRAPQPHHGPWRTGDRVRVDEAGNLFFVGRGDDVIVSSGYRIGPFEIESVLVEHPAVAEAAAVAAPDPERGSVVRAVVVLREGHEGSPALAAELQTHVRERTAPYKYPRVVDFARELPKTSSGKIRRAVLRSDF